MTGPDVYGLVARTRLERWEGGSWPFGTGCPICVDPTSVRPKLANHVEIREFPLRWGNDYVMVANTRDLVALPPRRRASVPLLEKMDGTRTVKELVLEEFESSGDLDPDCRDRHRRTLYQGNFLEQEYRDVDELVTRALDPVTDRRRRARTFAKTLTIEWKKAHRVVQWLYDHGLKYAFLKPVIAVQVVVAVAGLVAFVDLVVSGRFTDRWRRRSPRASSCCGSSTTSPS